MLEDLDEKEEEEADGDQKMSSASRPKTKDQAVSDLGTFMEQRLHLSHDGGGQDAYDALSDDEGEYEEEDADAKLQPAFKRMRLNPDQEAPEDHTTITNLVTSLKKVELRSQCGYRGKAVRATVPLTYIQSSDNKTPTVPLCDSCVTTFPSQNLEKQIAKEEQNNTELWQKCRDCREDVNSCVAVECETFGPRKKSRSALASLKTRRKYIKLFIEGGNCQTPTSGRVDLSW